MKNLVDLADLADLVDLADLADMCPTMHFSNPFLHPAESIAQFIGRVQWDFFWVSFVPISYWLRELHKVLSLSLLISYWSLAVGSIIVLVSDRLSDQHGVVCFFLVLWSQPYDMGTKAQEYTSLQRHTCVWEHACFRSSSVPPIDE